MKRWLGIFLTFFVLLVLASDADARGRRRARGHCSSGRVYYSSGYGYYGRGYYDAYSVPGFGVRYSSYPGYYFGPHRSYYPGYYGYPGPGVYFGGARGGFGIRW